MNKKKKEPFEFSYDRPCLDYYESKKITIQFDEYDYFELQRRFGPSWWLIGFKGGKAKDVGCLYDIARFIEWAKTNDGGSKLLSITAISTSFDLFKTISSLIEQIKPLKEEN